MNTSLPTGEVSLPPLVQAHSPNQSRRILSGLAPHLIVAHRPVGSYTSAGITFLDNRSEVSAHLLTNGSKGATQFVPWDAKAWACEAFNSVSYNIEVDDAAWTGEDPAGLATAARIFAYLCHKTGIPARWSKAPLIQAGIVRHYDLGIAGGGHTDPTTDTKRWLEFILLVQRQLAIGGFRENYGVGELLRYGAS